MTKAELEAKRIALVAEAEAIIEAHERLRFTPANSPEHAAHRTKYRSTKSTCAPTSANEKSRLIDY
jgi:hypothetical protein